MLVSDWCQSGTVAPINEPESASMSPREDLDAQVWPEPIGIILSPHIWVYVPRRLDRSMVGARQSNSDRP